MDGKKVPRVLAEKEIHGGDNKKGGQKTAMISEVKEKT